MRAVHRKMRRINSVAFVQQMRAKWGRMDAMARFRKLMHEKVRTYVRWVFVKVVGGSGCGGGGGGVARSS